MRQGAVRKSGWNGTTELTSGLGVQGLGETTETGLRVTRMKYVHGDSRSEGE
jgi:hypothetical protein